MTGGIAGGAAHLHGEALIVPEVTHLGQQLLASRGITVLHALKARPSWNGYASCHGQLEDEHFRSLVKQLRSVCLGYVVTTT